MVASITVRMLKALSKYVKDRLMLLMNPEKGIVRENTSKFEKSLQEYLVLLIIVSVAAGVFTFVYSMLRGLFYDLVYQIDVHYWNMANYALGRANGLLFFYLFAGTFILFFISLIINPFLRKVKYTKVLQILFSSMTPFLLFGWIPPLGGALFIWSLFLLVMNIRLAGKTKIESASYSQRD